MYRPISIPVLIMVSLQLFKDADAVEKSIAGGDLLLNLVGNVGGIVRDIEGGRALRRAITSTIGASSILPDVLTTPKPNVTKLTASTISKSKTRDEPLINSDKLQLKLNNQRPEYLQLDSAKAAQNQFPFDSRDNFNFPARQFNSGFFPNEATLNPEYPGSFGPFGSSNGLRPNENTIQTNPANPELANRLINRNFDNFQDSERFRAFQRFGNDNRFSEQLVGPFNSPFRQSNYPSPFTNYPGVQNVQDRENNYRQNLNINDYSNSLNNQRRFGLFPGYSPFQGYNPNNFDYLQYQRLQDSSGENFRGQRPSDLPLFYSTGRNSVNSGTSKSYSSSISSPLGINSSNGSAPGPVTSATKNSEKLQDPSRANREKNPGLLSEETPLVDLFGDRKFYPALDDYSDVRSHPHGGSIINSHVPAKRAVNDIM